MSERSIFLLVFLALLLVAVSWQDEFIYNSFVKGGGGDGGVNSSTAYNLSLNGAAEIQATGQIDLTNEKEHIIGHAFYPTPLLFKNPTDGSVFSFSTTFIFSIFSSYSYGGGLAFVITPTMELPRSSPPQYLGLFNNSNVGKFSNHLFAVEFDAEQNPEFYDINDNHVGIDINNLVSNISRTAQMISYDDRSFSINLRSGDMIQAWIDYDGVGKVINVTISPLSTKPSRPIIHYPVDLSPILHDRMFVGFSASTGLHPASHILFGWSFKMNGVARPLDSSLMPTLLPQYAPTPVMPALPLQHAPTPGRNKTTIAAAVSVSAFILLIAAASATAYHYHRMRNAEVVEPWELQYGPHRFSYKEVRRATKSFEEQELLGSGGFGKVYKGVLPGSKTEVAVKRVSRDSKQGLREFLAEIESIGRLRHRNLVQLQGWCRTRDDLLLVYDYMPSGSLDKFLFCKETQPLRPLLSWGQRIHILRGVASALLYLHEEWEHVVIHRDVKASNVLLDADMNGRLGDFGLAKLCEHGANPSTTRLVGTLGYLAPELTRTGKATTCSDVFAFGILVLEVVCGRRTIEPKVTPEEMVLAEWVRERWATGMWDDVVDPRLGREYDRGEAEVAVKVGVICSHSCAEARPKMREVVQFLNGGSAALVPDVPSGPVDSESGSQISVDVDVYDHASAFSSYFSGRT